MKRFLLLLGILVLSACTPIGGDAPVVTSIYPLHDLTSMIAGDTINVASLIPAGVEPHSYEPSPQDILKLQQADVFVISSLGFFESSLAASADVTTVAVGGPADICQAQGGNWINGVCGDLSQAQCDALGGTYNECARACPPDVLCTAVCVEVCEFDVLDPHFWLAPQNMIVAAKQISQALSTADAENTASYNQNTETVIAKLEQLDQEFTDGLATCQSNTIVVQHEAYGHLARAYGLEQLPITGLSGEGDLTPSQIRTIVDEASARGVTHVFFEELTDSRLSQTVANELGVSLLELNPLGANDDPNQDYFSLMRKNLENLREGLSCT